jgi:glutathione synthase/RimK-type ligase-like ATP-grasp enzyme
LPARLRAALLCPAADYPEAYDWAYDNQAEALEQAGFEVVGPRWTDPHCATGVDVVLPLVAWGYHLRFAEWLALLDRLETNRVPTLNPIPLLRWNSDKGYLAALSEAGIATVPTMAVDALDEDALAAARLRFDSAELVVKPPVSAGADGTFRIAQGDELPAAARGRRMLVQPFQRSVTTQGELSLLLFGGELSHALIKRPKSGDYRVQPHLGGTETLCEAPPEAIALAHAALAKTPAPATYARVDLIADEAGEWQVMELELIEPALWLPRAPGSATRFAAAIRAQAEQILAQR